MVDKATRPDRDAYSAFQDTGLVQTLKAQGIRRLVVGGLATDYCVLQTVLVALDSDAHSRFELAFLDQGIGQARRGWLEAQDVLNTRPLAALRTLLARTMR